MGHHQQRPVLLEFIQECDELPTARPVQSRCGFIQKQNMGLANQLHRDAQSSLLSAA